MKTILSAALFVNLIALSSCKSRAFNNGQAKSGAEFQTREGHLVVWAEPILIAKSQIFQCLYSFVHQPLEKTKSAKKSEKKLESELLKLNEQRTNFKMKPLSMAEYLEEQDENDFADSILLDADLKLKPMFSQNNFPVNSSWYAAALAGGAEKANSRIIEQAEFLKANFDSAKFKEGLSYAGENDARENKASKNVGKIGGLVDLATGPAAIAAGAAAGAFSPVAVPLLLGGMVYSLVNIVGLISSDHPVLGGKNFFLLPGNITKISLLAPMAAFSTVNGNTEWLIFQQKYAGVAIDRKALGSIAEVVTLSQPDNKDMIKYNTNEVFADLKSPSTLDKTNKPIKSQKLIESMQKFQNAYVKAAASNAASKVTKNGFASFLQNMSSEVWQKEVPNIAYIETECPEVGAGTTPIIWEKIQIEKKNRGVTESD